MSAPRAVADGRRGAGGEPAAKKAKPEGKMAGMSAGEKETCASGCILVSLASAPAQRSSAPFSENVLDLGSDPRHAAGS